MIVSRTGARRLQAVAVAAALVLGGFAVLLNVVPVKAESVDANGATTFQITATDIGPFTPSTISDVASGANVTVTFTDADSGPHTFTIYGRQGVVLPNPTTISPAALNALVYGNATYRPIANVNATAFDGAQFTATFNVPQPGWYEFMCMEPEHFQSGMYGFISFGEPLPANLSVSSPDTGPGAAVFIIVGTIVALVVIAIVLGFVVGRRRGSEFEMPPERLGYPEPEQPLPPPSGDETAPPGGPPIR
ncbi:MAG TPA: hypothetical protein VMG99_02870 [Thermoplasmata archaeon]|jgi:plastocyanin|nr:hypothetical protein [Thermoplasmata archaeon]